MKIRYFAMLGVLLGLFVAACGNGEDTQDIPENSANAMSAAADGEALAATGDSGLLETDDGNVWYGDWNKAVAEASELDKPLYIHFTADWCKWCRKMEDETYSTDEIRKRFKDWVLLKVDTEAQNKNGTVYLNEEERSLSLFPGGEGYTEESLPYPQLLRLFGGQGIPYLSFIDTEGSLLYAHPGYLTTAQFGPMLDYFQEELYAQDVNLGEYIESHQ